MWEDRTQRKCGSVKGALGQRTTIKEREKCGGVKGALGERTAHHLTYS